MGCNNTKSEDIKRSRVDQPQQQTPSKGTAAQNLSPPVNAAKNKALNETKNQAESFTDLRLKENEMFQNIIQKTQHNFIDISQSPGLMDENDSFMEQEQREHNLGESTISELKNPILFGLPEISRTENNSRDFLSKSTISEEDVQQFLRVTEMLLVAQESIRINDEGVGQLVVQLPVVEAE